MKTIREKELEEENKMLSREYQALKDRYDQLCGKLRSNANDNRNEGERFLSTYARDRVGPWN
jgi:hypothetical protein